MLDRESFYEEIEFSLGERYKPLFSSSIFLRIRDSCYDFIFYKNLELERETARAIFLEDLQEWEHLKNNYVPKVEKKDDTNDNTRRLYLIEKELMRSQL